MNEQPEITDEIRRWIEKAENDFRNAEYVITLKEDCPFDTVCFHCQQSAEKYLKALLIHYETEFPRTHDLVVLCNLLRNSGCVPFSVEELHPLNRYSIEARYPGVWEPVDEEDAVAALKIARQIRTAARGLLKGIIPAS